MFFLDELFFFFFMLCSVACGALDPAQGRNLGPGGQRQPARGQAGRRGLAKGWEQLWEAGSAQADPPAASLFVPNAPPGPPWSPGEPLRAFSVPGRLPAGLGRTQMSKSTSHFSGMEMVRTVGESTL